MGYCITQHVFLFIKLKNNKVYKLWLYHGLRSKEFITSFERCMERKSELKAI